MLNATDWLSFQSVQLKMHGLLLSYLLALISSCPLWWRQKKAKKKLCTPAQLFKISAAIATVRFCQWEARQCQTVFESCIQKKQKIWELTSFRLYAENYLRDTAMGLHLGQTLRIFSPFFVVVVDFGFLSKCNHPHSTEKKCSWKMRDFWDTTQIALFGYGLSPQLINLNIQK